MNLVNKIAKKLENWQALLMQKMIVQTKKDSHVAPPFKPSMGDMKNYEEILMKVIVKEKFLLLDSAPELADLLDRTSIKSVIIDPALFLNEFLKTGYFDVIMGDLVLNNIEPKLQKKFLSGISKSLKSGGFFISRLHFTGKDLDNLLTDYFIMRDFRLAGDYYNYKFYPVYVLQKR